jgi:glyoxylase-like metal-dependent hydrolase (beta-lactamase superfamily II)
VSTPEYDVFAIQYAQSIRPSRDYFMLPDPHDGPLPIFYFLWVLRSAERVVVVDTGFTAERAEARKRDFLRCPSQGLKHLGIDPASVETVILTHMHYDHGGNIGLFPNAEFIIQDREMAYATGRDMRYPAVRMPFEADDVCDAVHRNFEGRLRFVDGNEEVLPGISVVLVGGHSRGLQSVIVNTRRGRLILASDAAHFFDNMLLGNPFPVVVDIARNLESHERLMRMAETPDHFIPGHDPLVMRLYPQVEGDPLSVELSADPLEPSPLVAFPV